MHTGMRHVLFYLGTEAEFIKLYPVIATCIEKGLAVKLICNGQNNLRDSILMTEEMRARCVFLLKGSIWFPFKSFSSRAIWFLLWASVTFFKTFGFLLRERNASGGRPVFVVHGDTVSTLLGAVVAKILGYPILHVESGLTSGRLFNPFPEEISRRIVTRLAKIRFCPTSETYSHVKDYPGKRKLLTNGNSMWDMLHYGLKSAQTQMRPPYFLLVIHRQETLADPALFFEIIETVRRHQPADLTCVFILHHPTKSLLIAHDKLNELNQTPSWELVDRLPFFEFVHLLKEARCVLTDGGTNQEECYYLGTPCYLLRECTERHEGLGENVVLKPDYIHNISWFMQNYQQFRRSGVTFERSPSEIIAEEIAKECVL